jgi:hypothetical protein
MLTKEGHPDGRIRAHQAGKKLPSELYKSLTWDRARNSRTIDVFTLTTNIVSRTAAAPLTCSWTIVLWRFPTVSAVPTGRLLKPVFEARRRDPGMKGAY